MEVGRYCDREGAEERSLTATECTWYIWALAESMALKGIEVIRVWRGV